tara:strand:+ start:367 stop:1623 length:1257 start_codon:yes stop_codon:yes gene_type:complete
MIGMVANTLSQSEQGFYYSFNSMVALQILVELGLSVVIVQVVSHRMADLVWDPNGSLLGSQSDVDRVLYILKKLIQWYAMISVVLISGLIYFGTMFLGGIDYQSEVVFWKLPWILLALSFCYFFMMASIFPFFEGAGRIEEVARVRLIGSIISSFAAFSLFFLDLGLFAPAAIFLFLGITFHVWLASAWRLKTVKLAMNVAKPPGALTWKRDILPMQWRIAISWISGYAIFHLFTPIMLFYHGPILAGKMGITLAVITGMGTLAGSWVSTKAPLFGRLISNGEFSALDKLFSRVMRQSLWVAIIIALFFLMIIKLVGLYHPALAIRFLNMDTLVMLCYVSIVNHCIFSMAVYLRAHKNELLLANSVFSAALIALSVIFLGKSYGANGAVFGYSVVMTFSFLWVRIIFLRQKREHLIGG